MASATVTGNPIPTKFDEPEEKLIRDLGKLTGLPLAQIIKRAGRFALPKFASGEIDILTLKPGTKVKALAGAHKDNGR